MSSSHQTPSAAGAAIYSLPLHLRFFYDFWELGISNTFFWRCPSSKVLLPFFRKNSSKHNHLDIGVGTGDYLANTPFAEDASVTLCDLNENSLAMASARLGRKGSARCLLHDIENPFPIDEKFESISLMYLLHCMSGPPSRKATILGHLARNLITEGVLFGATVLGKGVEHNWGEKLLMRSCNNSGIFSNWDDGAEVFLTGLREVFEEVEARVEGTVLCFVARRLRL